MKKLFSLIGLTLLICPHVRADISWMKGANDCESFAPALDAYLDKVDLSKYSLFPFWQKEELAIALREACTGKFSKCNIEACKKWGSLTTFNIPQENGVQSSLFWLNRFLTCEQLMEQIKSRYTNIPEHELSSEVKQKEFRLVLSAACSDRFSHCSFASCKEFNKGKIDKDQLTGLDSRPKEKKQSQNYQALRENMIRLAIEEEKGATWKRFSNPEEAQILARRREEARRRKSNEPSELYSSSSSSQYDPFVFQGSAVSSSRATSRRKSFKRSSSTSGLKQGILPV